ncbi:MAG: sensor histidine kinase [Spirochaetales bacterium]|nr:sensor histidine kinase [Spirochaetales bacterium]
MIKFFKSLKNNGALKITFIYVIFALLWIFLSDKLISSLTDSVRILTTYSNIKGILFIVITGILLYSLIKKRINEKNSIITDLDKEVRIREQLIKELHHRIKNNMQVVISLIKLETNNIAGLKELDDRIVNKLISMMSIFNIVYDIHDMNRISLNMVIHEYVRISIRNLNFIISELEPEYSIELITSLMLIIDSIIEVYKSDNSSFDKIDISLIDFNKIRLDFIELKADTEIKKEDKEFINFQLVAISGSIEIDYLNNRILIIFDNTI